MLVGKAQVAAQSSGSSGSGLLGGPDILVLIVLALGAAMLVGNVLALLRPPPGRGDGELERAPVARSVAMAVIGAIAAVWAIASLVT